MLNERQALRIIYILSAVLVAAVAVIYNLPKANRIPEFVLWLPRLNALINTTCTLLLVASFIAIKRGRVKLHKRLNISTFALSALFLLSYVTFHTFGVETRFPADNPSRPFYLFVLITHIVLAAIVLPLVLVTLYRGLVGPLDAHRRLARWTFPIWLYVTVTGVLVYIMISPYYKF
jgi:putative membrane protein